MSLLQRTRLLVVLPDRNPLLTKKTKLNPVPVLAVTEHRLTLLTFDLVATAETVVQTALVESDDVGVDPVEVQGIEGVLEERHLGITTKTLPPIFLLTDQRSCGGDPVNPVDLMEPH